MKILRNAFYRLEKEFDRYIKLYFINFEVLYYVNITIDSICCFHVWIKYYEPRYVKVYKSDIEEQLTSTKAMDHEVYIVCVRRLSQMDSQNYTWPDLLCSRIFLAGTRY